MEANAIKNVTDTTITCNVDEAATRAGSIKY